MDGTRIAGRSMWPARSFPLDILTDCISRPGEEMETLLQADGFAEHTKKSPGQYHVEKYW